MTTFEEKEDGINSKCQNCIHFSEESGLPHLWHMATNVAFLGELEKFNVK